MEPLYLVSRCSCSLKCGGDEVGVKGEDEVEGKRGG